MPAFSLVALEPDSDGLHPAGSDPWWREAWYFEFYDSMTRLQLQIYQGVFPNAGRGDLTVGLFHRGRLLHELIKMDYHLPLEPIEERLCFGPLRLEMLEPFAAWRLRYDTPAVQADLRFQALHAPFSWAEARLWMEKTADPGQRSQHFDQFGRYQGSIWTSEGEIPIDALGFRDRMWGWGGRKHWRSYAVAWAGFNPDFVVNAALLCFDDGRQSICGYLHENGERALLQSARAEIEWDQRRWKSVAGLCVTAQDVRGRSVELTGRPQGILDTSRHWPHRLDHMLFSVGEYRCRDQTGYGVMNWAFRTAAERPQMLEARLEPES